METGPCGVVQLESAETGPAPPRDVRQRPEKGVPADDPEHVESPERVQGPQPVARLRLGSHGPYSMTLPGVCKEKGNERGEGRALSPL